MIDGVRPHDSGKSSAAPDHLRAERMPASWHRSTKLRELGTASDEIGACGTTKTFFSAKLRRFFTFSQEKRQSFKLVQPLIEK